MLEKLGKADIGEASKAMGLVFVVGLILAVIGGTLATMVANDTTDYADIAGDDATKNATKIIGQFHLIGKGFVGLLAFWFPIVGVIMVAVGLGVLSLDRTLYVIVASVALAALLVLLQDAIALHVMVPLYVGALSFDVISTVRSGRFPGQERNVIISVMYKRVGMKKTWILYAASYGVIVGIGSVLLGGAYTILAIMVSVHAMAAICNMLSGRAKTVQHMAC